jgi:hypothetical protein
MRPSSRQERRELARAFADVLEAMPEPLLMALDLLIGATQHGRAGVVLVVGGSDVRVSIIRAEADSVTPLVGTFDAAFAEVPVNIDMRGGADAKSTH